MADSRRDKEIAIYGEVSEDTIVDALEIVGDLNPQLALDAIMEELQRLTLYIENQSDGPTDLLENVLSTLKVLTGERL